MGKIRGVIYNKFIRTSQAKIKSKIINSLDGVSILDIGCKDDILLKKLNPKFEYVGIDINPKSDFIEKIDINDYNPKKKFDMVCAFNVLEHLTNPVKTMEKMKLLSNKYILVMSPYEPYFTILRFFKRIKEHYWVISPEILKYYFGEPIIEKYIHLKRQYFGVYKI